VEPPQTPSGGPGDDHLGIGGTRGSTLCLERVGRRRRPKHAVVNPNERASGNVTGDCPTREAVVEQIIECDDAVASSDRFCERA
jgi:hypothetical protein